MEREHRLNYRELLDLARYKILSLSLEELTQFVADLLPTAEANKKEGFNGPQPWRI